MCWFEPYVPSADLREVLECRYVAATAGRHDLLPDGCMDLVWTDQIGTVLCGPDTHVWSFEMPAGRQVAGVRFRAGAAADVFRVAASSLVDRRVPLADLVGSHEARLLDEMLADAADGPDRMRAIEELVRRRVAAPDPTVALAHHVTSDPVGGVEQLAARSGVSARQLRRRFDRAVG